MIKYIGLSIFIITVLVFLFRYKEKIAERKDTYIRVRELFIRLKEYLGVRAVTIDDIFADEELSSLLFRDEQAPKSKEGVVACIKKLPLDKEDAEALTGFIIGYGRGNIASEEERVRTLLGYFDRRRGEVVLECDTELKLSVVLCISLIAGVLFLLI